MVWLKVSPRLAPIPDSSKIPTEIYFTGSKYIKYLNVMSYPNPKFNKWFLVLPFDLLHTWYSVYMYCIKCFNEQTPTVQVGPGFL